MQIIYNLFNQVVYDFTRILAISHQNQYEIHYVTQHRKTEVTVQHDIDFIFNYRITYLYHHSFHKFFYKNFMKTWNFQIANFMSYFYCNKTVIYLDLNRDNNVACNGYYHYNFNI